MKKTKKGYWLVFCLGLVSLFIATGCQQSAKQEFQEAVLQLTTEANNISTEITLKDFDFDTTDASVSSSEANLAKNIINSRLKNSKFTIEVTTDPKNKKNTQSLLSGQFMGETFNYEQWTYKNKAYISVSSFNEILDLLDNFTHQNALISSPELDLSDYDYIEISDLIEKNNITAENPLDLATTDFKNLPADRFTREGSILTVELQPQDLENYTATLSNQFGVAVDDFLLTVHLDTKTNQLTGTANMIYAMDDWALNLALDFNCTYAQKDLTFKDISKSNTLTIADLQEKVLTFPTKEEQAEDTTEPTTEETTTVSDEAFEALLEHFNTFPEDTRNMMIDVYLESGTTHFTDEQLQKLNELRVK